jgi:hypothetical protein
MRKWAVLALIAISRPAWPCGGESEPLLPDVPIRDFLEAQRRFDAGDYQAVLREMDGYDWPGTPAEGRYRLLVSAARFRVVAGEARQLGQLARDVYTLCPRLGGRWKPAAMAALEQLAGRGVLPDPRGLQALRRALESVRAHECPSAQEMEQAIRDRVQSVGDWVSTLRDQYRQDGGDPTLAAILAEGMSLLGGQGEAALVILNDLDARELIPDAWGFAALARLRLARGDAAGAARAALRCRRMARDAGICPAVPVG